MMKKIVILGAGYAGVRTAKTLEKLLDPKQATVTLVNKHNYHQFLTEICEPAAGASPYDDVRLPLLHLLKERRTALVKGVAQRIDLDAKRVYLDQGFVDYDILVVALGSEAEYYDIPGLAQHALNLRSLNNARLVRTHVENMFARAKNEPERAGELLTFVIGGAGFTGVEMAGELADAVPELCRKYDVDSAQVKLICLEASHQVLPGLDPQLGQIARQVLEGKGVQLRLQTPLAEVQPEAVRLRDGSTIATHTLIWTGGVRGHSLVAQAGLPTKGRGRAVVNQFLQAPGHREVFVAGDTAWIEDPATGQVLPATAQLAIQQGELVAQNVAALVRGEDLRPYRPKQVAVLVSLGRDDAVGRVGNLTLHGRYARVIKRLVTWRYLHNLGGVRLLLQHRLHAGHLRTAPRG